MACVAVAAITEHVSEGYRSKPAECVHIARITCFLHFGNQFQTHLSTEDIAKLENQSLLVLADFTFKGEPVSRTRVASHSTLSIFRHCYFHQSYSLSREHSQSHLHIFRYGSPGG